MLLVVISCPGYACLLIRCGDIREVVCACVCGSHKECILSIVTPGFEVDMESAASSLASLQALFPDAWVQCETPECDVEQSSDTPTTPTSVSKKSDEPSRKRKRSNTPSVESRSSSSQSSPSVNAGGTSNHFMLTRFQKRLLQSQDPPPAASQPMVLHDEPEYQFE